MTERRVTYIVTERNCLNQIRIKAQRLAYCARYTRNQLNVQYTAGYIVVFIKREHLRFIRIAVEIGAMYNFIRIPYKCGSDSACLVTPVISAQGVFFFKSINRKIIFLSVIFYLFRNIIGKFFVIQHYFHPDNYITDTGKNQFLRKYKNIIICRLVNAGRTINAFVLNVESCNNTVKGLFFG